MYQLQFAYPFIFSLFIPALIILIVYRIKIYRSPIYKYPLTDTIIKKHNFNSIPRKKILFTLRLVSLISLIFLIARPQWTDARSSVNVKGVDIVIALDVSGSMTLFDDVTHPTPRINVAKTEALNFIDKRTDDPIGLVIFARDAVSMCPLTLDKHILKNLVGNISLGVISPDGTSLATGLATAINKLRHSKAKSKIIILLTDGQPTPHTEKLSMENAVELAQKQKIKVYAIGIGNKDGGYYVDMFGSPHQNQDSIDEALLQRIATETGGKFFRVKNAKEMKEVYQIIDSLEKTKYKTKLFQKKYEALTPFIWLLLLIVLTELLLRLFVWRGLFL